MKFIFPCIMVRIIRRAASGISRSAFVAPSRGGTSDHKVLTVPALPPPARFSAKRQEITTAKTRIRARMEVDDFMFTSRGEIVAGIYIKKKREALSPDYADYTDQKKKVKKGKKKKKF